jgi:hypothetical protein
LFLPPLAAALASAIASFRGHGGGSSPRIGARMGRRSSAAGAPSPQIQCSPRKVGDVDAVVFCSVSLPRFTCCLVGDDGFFHFLSRNPRDYKYLPKKSFPVKCPTLPGRVPKTGPSPVCSPQENRPETGQNGR